LYEFNKIVLLEIQIFSTLCEILKLNIALVIIESHAKDKQLVL